MFYVHVNRINRFEYESSKNLNLFWQNKRTRSTKYAGSYINRHSFTYHYVNLLVRNLLTILESGRKRDARSKRAQI